MSIVQTILASALCSLIAGLITYYLTSKSYKEVVSDMVKKEIALHEKINHSKSIEEMLLAHSETCDASKSMVSFQRNIQMFKMALVFIIQKQNLGTIEDLKNMGLLD